jgi:hypothetical protein
MCCMVFHRKKLITMKIPCVVRTVQSNLRTVGVPKPKCGEQYEKLAFKRYLICNIFRNPQKVPIMYISVTNALLIPHLSFVICINIMLYHNLGHCE